MAKDGWMKRKEAARFLTDQCGYSIAAQTLANMACDAKRKKGPPFQRRGWTAVYYHEDDLRTWAAAQPKRAQSPESAAHRIPCCTVKGGQAILFMADLGYVRPAGGCVTLLRADQQDPWIASISSCSSPKQIDAKERMRQDSLMIQTLGIDPNSVFV